MKIKALLEDMYLKCGDNWIEKNHLEYLMNQLNSLREISNEDKDALIERLSSVLEFDNDGVPTNQTIEVEEMIDFLLKI